MYQYVITVQYTRAPCHVLDRLGGRVLATGTYVKALKGRGRYYVGKVACEGTGSQSDERVVHARQTAAGCKAIRWVAG